MLKLFIALFAVLALSTATAQVTHVISFTVLGAVQNVTVNTGDVLEFRSPGYVIDMLRVATTPTNLINHAVAPYGNVLSYTVLANDTAYWITNSNGGQFHGRITHNVATGISEYLNTNSVKVFPNPTTDILKVTTTLEKSNIGVFTQFGQLVIKTTVESGTSDLDVSQLASGIYYVRVDNFTTKIIKQ